MKFFSKFLKVFVIFVVMLTSLLGGVNFAFSKVNNEKIINGNDILAATGDIILDQGTANEWVVPAGSTGKVETGVDASFTQSSQNKMSFLKQVLKSEKLSEVNDSIQGMVKTADGGMLVAVFSHNHTQTPPWYVTTVLKIDISGKVVSKRSLATWTPTPSISYGNSDTSKDQSLAVSTIFDHGNGTYSMLYDGYTPSDKVNNIRRKVTFDQNLNNQTYVNINPPSPSVDTEVSGHSAGYNDGKIYSVPRIWDPVDGRTITYVHELNAAGVYTNVKSFNISDFRTYVPKINNWAHDITIERSVGSMYFGYQNLFSDYLNTGLGKHIVTIWNSNGTIKFVAPPKKTGQTAADNVNVAIQSQISDASTLYWMEYNNQGSYLRKMDTATGIVTDLQTFPVGSKMTITPNVDVLNGTTYDIFGSSTNTGVFNGYGSGGGIFYGALRSDFSVYSANFIITNGATSFSNTLPTNTTGLFYIAGTTAATNFADAPTGGCRYAKEQQQDMIISEHTQKFVIMLQPLKQLKSPF